MILGGRREPFLAPCLATLEGVVDLLVVEVNGSCDDNVRDLEASALFRAGRLRHEAREFTSFAASRNHTLELLPPGEGWILKVDADEVHDPEALALVTRGLLPALPDAVGILDAYVLQFMQSFRYLTSVDRRHEFLVRRQPGLAFSGDVHEQLLGTRGRRLAAPYVYGHFGYVRDPAEVLDKWKHYATLGDGSYDPRELEQAVAEGYLDEQASLCRPFRGRHPEALEPLREALEREAGHVARFDRLMASRDPAPELPRARQRLRILWRVLPLWLAVGRSGRGPLLDLVSRLFRSF